MRAAGGVPARGMNRHGLAGGFGSSRFQIGRLLWKINWVACFQRRADEHDSSGTSRCSSTMSNGAGIRPLRG